jgi:hypothetical protein
MVSHTHQTKSPLTTEKNDLAPNNKYQSILVWIASNPEDKLM